jgi:hypothetical protein
MYIEWQSLALRHLYVTCPARVKSQKGGLSDLISVWLGKSSGLGGEKP